MANKLKAGDTAPDFSALDQKGELHSLQDHKGKWLLLYFYPKDNTPGCIKEACSFRDNFTELKERIEILGVSGDSLESHINFSNKYKLPFPLLVDKDRKIIKSYGTDGLLFPKRASFLIDPDGKIARVYEKVNPEVHAEEIIKVFNLANLSKTEFAKKG
ncbi:hypothetical protein A3A76_06100 [Candidatus Woesebacteria bacterium RIFCSPLOWO2_01_FULL_39_23]|uniref:thioredoxin-dependent peroxiredoxin n=1 Tax=Candidatus Woesebacteria bacterium RIFCSPHIGHO2_01_FULL_40_22 TaxID=1802499 RepID=A0A1F7YHZ4_9BACT|nr:MAG: hypothetical protein A2141_02795 [Candidatus Woesebacteria bacterium RBG_16_40_11]OGM26974.1 MAG: hypothetical protein A2628_06040 [Candidatus Woesebacteria bacterium RIFCSPHIGHO2_01_FULL_40_22]OGM37381.1 MAG: hypothetical protein A3E41_04445 [Candidatus Woesebacteria bacterium RIFCSPHIGHO2_12_FULL_38_9]OGM63249.1 MAG: hypothetical protein A3A76_06100 [Candidatus Woesebacteria bacterium RIFCSPLOWO2_01_FULL_39_23]